MQHLVLHGNLFSNFAFGSIGGVFERIANFAQMKSSDMSVTLVVPFRRATSEKCISFRYIQLINFYLIVFNFNLTVNKLEKQFYKQILEFMIKQRRNIRKRKKKWERKGKEKEMEREERERKEGRKREKRYI